ncbi:hypothetical protein E4T66_10635 [Sinimarinibacterium sp. CAU 1509]|uniref:hypothetical protein n=1 Tax=Sinimarinibacterium sp. CAU 1509 TaxID=2562283 RepID=UPI0010AC052D|nr:hypothetical protein [Sinimarinibacterium sp. CAU 1509]TJY61078.1 hypothetical protein E4T66_10635 [Sinimarinibacterium sp. CAU 1509]
MTFRGLTVLLVASLALSACASNRHCAGVQPYQESKTLVMPTNIDGLTVPESASALRIPPPPEKPVGFGIEVTDPKDPEENTLECLDFPPRMPVEEAAAASTPSPEPAAPAEKQ